MINTYLFLGSGSFLPSFLLCKGLKNIFLKNKFLTNSNLVIKEGNRLIPLVGGISIFLTFSFMVILFESLGILKLFFPLIKVVLWGGTLILLIGALDDLLDLSPWLKLLGQLLAALVPLYFGIHTKIIYIPHQLNLILTIIWIVAIINAFNFLDTMDGLVGGVGLIISLVYLILGLYTGNLSVTLIALIMTGTLLPFLIFNFPPASIYLGDMGSMYLGFVISNIALHISYAPENHEFALISPIIILGLPLYELIYATLRRIKYKRSIIEKSEDHFAMQLIKSGYNKNQTLFVMYGFCTLFGATAIAITLFKNEISILIFLLFIAAFVFLNRRIFK